MLSHEQINEQTPVIEACEIMYQSSSAGMCWGISVAGAEHFLVDGRRGLAAFYSYLFFIRNDRNQGFPQLQHFRQILLAKNQIEQPEDMALLGALSNIAIYQSPAKYIAELGDLYQPEDITPIAEKLALSYLKEKGGLKKTAGWFQINDRAEVEKMLAVMSQCAAQHASHNFAMVIGSGKHAISLVHEAASRLWLIIDANQIYSRPLIFVEAQDHEKAYEEIAYALRLPKNNDIQFELCISFLELGCHLPNQLLSDFFSTPDFQAITLLTPRKLSFVGENQYSVAHFAVRHNDMHALDQIQQIDTLDASHETPLFIAIRCKYTDMVHRLIQRNVNLNRKKPNGLTPLLLATETGNIQIIEMLISSGAIFDENNDWNLLTYAITFHHPHVIQYLIQNIDSDRVYQLATCGLCIAALHGYRDCIHMLLRCGGNPEGGFTYSKDHFLTYIDMACCNAGSDYVENKKPLLDNFLLTMETTHAEQSGYFTSAREIANMLGFHDIVSDLTPPVPNNNRQIKRPFNAAFYKPTKNPVAPNNENHDSQSNTKKMRINHAVKE